MMTDEELAAIRERAETFTDYLVGRRDDVGNVAVECLNAYRDDIPALLAEVERLREYVYAVAHFEERYKIGLFRGDPTVALYAIRNQARALLAHDA